MSTISQFVNMAMFEIANAAPHALQERIAVSSTTSGEQRLDLPSDFGEPISFRLTIFSSVTTPAPTRSYTTLSRMNPAEIDAQWSDAVATPEKFALYNNWIELWPSPDSGYSLQLRYRSMATDLVATTDIPSISTPMRQGIVYRAEVLTHEYLGNFAAAQAAQLRYLSYMEAQKTDEARRQLGLYNQGVTAYYRTRPST